ncbi:MAG TPA: threonine synthase [Ilumatobacteraceae bacterium]|nr:threonine synthase [Ilumatobacteraceae bacterium]
MRYVSTRGGAPELGFTDVLLAGLATDGGLYVPSEWPCLPRRDDGMDYAARAAQIMQLFVGNEIDADVLAAMCMQAYAAFDHPAVVPLVQIDDDHFVEELFHGPTLAFKDLALQLVGRLFEHVLSRQGRRVTIVAATSGDTGSAAIDGMKHCAHADIVILFPKGRTSEVQRRQMTTVESPNVHVVAIDGSFDDCQDLVKAMFADTDFRDRHDLSAVNSINWARVMAQVVYYVTATDHLRGNIDVCVPSGNFGNVFAGWIAKQMGAPIGRLVVASNANDILTRFFTDNDMTTRPVVPSFSPSMDIQVSSNFERLLFEINGRDGGQTGEQLQRFRSTGKLSIEPDQRAEFVDDTFIAARIDDTETVEAIRRLHASTGLLVDPHTAVGIGVVERLRSSLTGQVVTMATAHPAKFPDAVERATGIRPSLPERLGDLMSRPEFFRELPNDLVAVQRFVESRVAADGK